MEEEFTRKPYVVTRKFKESRMAIYEYSLDTFGYLQAERYLQKIDKSLDKLPDSYTANPECRFIATKSRKYRNIILDAHLIIYRISSERIEVLDIIHSASSIGKIRSVRKITI